MGFQLFQLLGILHFISGFGQHEFHSWLYSPSCLNYQEVWYLLCGFPFSYAETWGMYFSELTFSGFSFSSFHLALISSSLGEKIGLYYVYFQKWPQICF